MAKDPAFLFYSSDFMMGCMFMSMEQRGQYISLLCAFHQHGRLTISEIETILHGKCPEVILDKLKVDGDQYYSERLETEMNKRKVFAESRRNSLKIDNGDMVHLYMIYNPDTGHYKIGSSKYPELRLKEAQKFKREATLFWISEILVERINEKHLHDEFQEKRKRYDWFELNKKDLETIRTRFSKAIRTDERTENEIINENENEIIIGLKKEWSIILKTPYANQRPKLIYDLRLYFQQEGKLPEFERAGFVCFDEFMQANPANEFKDDNHLYNAFRKFHVEKQLLAAAAKSGKKKLTLAEIDGTK